MYTWGYIKESALSKINLTEEEANQLDFLSKFPYYANEAMTQICSAIKPQEKFLSITVYDKGRKWVELTKMYNVYHNISLPIDKPEEVDKNEELFWTAWNKLYFIDDTITMPEDFISFNTDVVEFTSEPIYFGSLCIRPSILYEANDEDLEYEGYNQIRCHKAGKYRIPYNARWFFFTKDLHNSVVISAPADICDAIPSYIASQCLKIDDEQKASIFRNEYEIFLSRIDNTTFRSQRTLHVGGGW